MDLPKSHPRYRSLLERHRIVDGMKRGFVAEAGLIAHGRGEAFDYLLGERSTEEALAAERAAVALMLSSVNPVISVNGNVAALVAHEIVELSKALNARIEVNLFYRTPERELLIEEILKKEGAEEVLGVGENATERIPGLESERARADPRGIFSADTVLVPLEDGDRVEALVSLGKNVISIDLNPLSRSARKATLTIVDNVSRAIPNMTALAGELKDIDKDTLQATARSFDNEADLEKITRMMREGLLSQER